MNGSTNGTSAIRLSDVAYVESMRALVIKFANGHVYAVPLVEMEGTDASPVTGVSLGSDGYAAILEQESGNRLEVPWDVILFHSEPDYSFYKHGGVAARAAADRQEIGSRIHLERLERHWTLADLSARTGIKTPNLSRLEKGKHVPSLETLEKVAEAFDLPVAALVSARSAGGPRGIEDRS
jgi:DNA-binding Xre family transcriptional regulator